MKDALDFFCVVPEIRQKNVNVDLERFSIMKIQKKNSEGNVSPILPPYILSLSLSLFTFLNGREKCYNSRKGNFQTQYW